MRTDETLQRGIELCREVYGRQTRRTAAALENIGRGRYGPAEALADSLESWRETARLWSDLGALWSRGALDCVARKERPEREPVLGPVHGVITTLSYGKVEGMPRTAEAKVTIRGVGKGAWVSGLFQAGSKKAQAGPEQTNSKGFVTLRAAIDATTQLAFKVTQVSHDRDGKRPYDTTGDLEKAIQMAHVASIDLEYKS